MQITTDSSQSASTPVGSRNIYLFGPQQRLFPCKYAAKIQNCQGKRKVLSSVTLRLNMVDTIQIGRIGPREEETVEMMFEQDLKIEGLCHRQVG
jgi:hypothetical protein